jgi:GNAT superfamily N-acetyltransferase
MIREAVIADVPRLVEMGCRFIAAYPDRIATNPAQLDHLARWLIDGAGVIFVSERTGAVTGMLGAVIFPHPMSGQRTASEMFWWVEPDSRGEGIKLLKRMEQWAQAEGAERILMIAPTLAVGHLYNRLGYTAIETSYVRTL